MKCLFIYNPVSGKKQKVDEKYGLYSKKIEGKI